MPITPLDNLKFISESAGKPEYVQGGGGNTSSKLDENRMAVKASGFRLDEVNPNSGHVVVDYTKIKEYFYSIKMPVEGDIEKESAAYIKSTVIKEEGKPNLRPSIEAGFHSFLDKYVIHTHSVYANLLCCCEQGKEIAQELFGDDILWLDYEDPGFYLTFAVKNGVDEYKENKGNMPKAIFIENHGIIVASDDAKEAVKNHEDVSKRIAQRFNINQYPQIGIEEIGQNSYKSTNKYLKGYFVDFNRETFLSSILYPDQIVYLGSGIVFDKNDDKICINTKTGEVVYNCGYKEALTIEELLTAFVFLIKNIEDNNLTIKNMTDKAIGFICGMEGEAYRKKLLNS